PFADVELRARSLEVDPRGIAKARGYDMDGHRGFSVSFTKDLDSKIERGIRRKLQIGIDYDKLYDADVPRRPAEWSPGGHTNLEATLSFSRTMRRVKFAGSVRVR